MPGDHRLRVTIPALVQCMLLLVFMTSENSIPHMHMRREITAEGRGKITFALSETALAAFLSSIGAANLSDIPEEALRLLCHYTRKSSIMAQLARDEEENPGQIVVQIGEDDDNLAEFHSSDLGFDMVRRLIPEEGEAMETLLDPQHSPVDVELGILAIQNNEAGLPQIIAQTLLRTTLEPPCIL